MGLGCTVQFKLYISIPNVNTLPEQGREGDSPFLNCSTSPSVGMAAVCTYRRQVQMPSGPDKSLDNLKSQP